MIGDDVGPTDLRATAAPAQAREWVQEWMRVAVRDLREGDRIEVEGLPRGVLRVTVTVRTDPSS